MQDAVATDKGLSASAMQVLMVIENSPAVDGWHEMSHTEIVGKTGRHRTTIGRALLLLQEHGYLVKSPPEKRGWHRKIRYQVVVQ